MELRVLVVEDDAEMRLAYRRLFASPSASAFKADIVADGESAAVRLREAEMDLLVLDWGLPGISGTTLLRALRADVRWRALGVLMVTGRAGVAETVAGLDAGADDYLVKPLEEKVFFARLKSLSRRREFTFESAQERRIPGLALDLAAESLSVDGRDAKLRRKEFDLLKIFLRRPRVLHSRRYLWDTVWGYESDGWEHVLDTVVSSLRRKLGAPWGRRLQARRGQGYLFDA